MDRISTFYKNRHKTVDKIIEVIDILTHSKKGNYIVFFPSYQYLQLIYNELQQRYNDFQIIIQEPNMSKEERQSIINLFDDISTAKIGLFVLGGVFSEGIDFTGNKLSGAVIVGVGHPQINFYNELLKNYYESKFQQGIDYAYTYPGFNKVLQAAGRVIRTANDKGVVIIIDERITSAKYFELLPNHWKHFKVINKNTNLQRELDDFWQMKH